MKTITANYNNAIIIIIIMKKMNNNKPIIFLSSFQYAFNYVGKQRHSRQKDAICNEFK